LERRKRIVQEEQNGEERAKYGKYIIKNLSIKLTDEYGQGFDESNLRNIRKFYNVYPKRDSLRHELSWTHYRHLMRVDKKGAREFYQKESIEGNWSTRQLERQINTLYFERLSMSRDKKDLILDAENKRGTMQPENIIKDPFVLEFLNVKQDRKLTERELETILIDKLQHFLLELGKGFAFVDRQYRITTETGKHFYIDLVFYNYILKCFLLIDLKTEELKHQDVGQMDMYVRMFEDLRKSKNDNPTIGLILCTKKDRTIVKYSVLNESKQIFASKYQMYLPTEKQLEEEIQREKQQLEEERKLYRNK
jgi:predicted nuclease of restriction endonuclease-like (RecB) superfamily